MSIAALADQPLFKDCFLYLTNEHDIRVWHRRNLPNQASYLEIDRLKVMMYIAILIPSKN